MLPGLGLLPKAAHTILQIAQTTVTMFLRLSKTSPEGCTKSCWPFYSFSDSVQKVSETKPTVDDPLPQQITEPTIRLSEF